MKTIPMKLNLKKASLVLEAARKIICDKRHWTQGNLARTETGFLCRICSPHAHAFCALGAVKRINGPVQASAVAFLREAARTLRRNTCGPFSDKDIFTVNDFGGHRAALKMFARAIRQAKKVGK